MSRKSRKRASRALIGVLVGTIAIGSVFYFRNIKNADAAPAETSAEPSAKPAITAEAKPPADVAVIPAKKTEPEKPAAPSPFVTSTPTGPAGAVAALTTSTPTAVAAAPSTPTTPTPAPTPAPVTPAVAAGPAMVATTDGPKPAAMEKLAEQRTLVALNDTTTTALKPAPAAAVAPVAAMTTIPTLAQAKAKADAGQMLAARNDYNAAFVSGKLSPADAAAAKGALMEINKTVVFSPRRFADDTWASSYVVKSGDRLAKVASTNDVTWEFICKINGMSDPRKLRAGQTLKLVKGPFHAVVSKSTFTMDLYLGGPGSPGSLYVTSFPVGLGSNDSTPTGTWEIKPQSKLRNPTYYSPKEEGERIIAADDPKNPLGEYWMGLVGTDGHAVGKESYGIHGTIEPDSIGKMASMGCIRLVNDNVAQVFDMMVEGKSTVVVKE